MTEQRTLRQPSSGWIRKLELATELKAIENEILSLIGAETFDGCQTIINQLLGNLRRKEETKILNKLNRLYKGTLKLPESRPVR